MATLYDHTGHIIAEGLPAIEDSDATMDLAIRESHTRLVILENEEDEGVCIAFLKGSIANMYESWDAFVAGKALASYAR